MKILIADSDIASADVLDFAAKRRGHQSAAVGSQAELMGRLPFKPDVIVLGGTFGELPIAGMVQVREAYPDATLVVTVEKPREPVATMLLNAGVNEVVRVPYNPSELLLRAENILSARSGRKAEDDALRLGDLELALDRYAATKNGTRLNLTKLELRLLYCLCEHSPHLTPTERLLAFGWDTLGDPDATLVKTHISHIRKKLRDAGGIQFEITSRQTLGYTLSVGT